MTNREHNNEVDVRGFPLAHEDTAFGTFQRREIAMLHDPHVRHIQVDRGDGAGTDGPSTETPVPFESHELLAALLS